MEEILKLVGNFGFPIVLCVFLLVRIEGKLDEFSSNMTELAKGVAARKS